MDLITAPDELERCCVVRAGVRCTGRTSVRIAGGAWDEYTYACSDCAAEVLRDSPDCTATCCTCPGGDLRDAECPLHGLATLEVPADLQRYDYLDGITVMAASQEAADRMHAEMVARRRRAKA